MQPVLVLGGTGHYGRRIVASLRKLHQPVRVLTRDPVRSRHLFDERVELVEGDITDPASVRQALNGIGTIIISVSAFAPKLIRRLREIEYEAVLDVIKAAGEQGVERVIYISVYDIRDEVLDKVNRQFASIARYKKAVEEYLAHSSFNWTVLGAPPAMDMFFAFIRGNRMIVPGGGPPALPTVSPVDVGEIAAQSALRNDLSGRRLRMTGPRAYSFAEAAQIISAAINREISVKKIPLLPISAAGLLAWPVFPYLRYIAGSATMLNLFPTDLAEAVHDDHQLLHNLFDYDPVTLEMTANEWGNEIENSTHK